MTPNGPYERAALPALDWPPAETIDDAGAAPALRLIESSPSESVSAVRSWAAEQYAETCAALGQLGFEKRQLAHMPALEQVQAALEPHATYLQAESHELLFGYATAMVGLRGLMRRFDGPRAQANSSATYVWERLWSQYDDRSPEHDADCPAPVWLAVGLNDTVSPIDLRQPANEFDEPGLVYADMSAAQQARALAWEQATHAKAGRQLRPVTIGQYLVQAAKRRERGDLPMDQHTATRLPHYTPEWIGWQVEYQPMVSTAFGLTGSGHAGSDAKKNEGIRRVLDLSPALAR